ncbi:hypothetical protein HU200_064583 [Digitaria exilis]|uniref:Uncharacterized protein n=1 Tax=Digitaria exilis TaxID=1010633 RepID=A0A835DVE4_9POAL|nr:hypothetical protein HU200_064583 [Digitaria exilis]
MLRRNPTRIEVRSSDRDELEEHLRAAAGTNPTTHHHHRLHHAAPAHQPAPPPPPPAARRRAFQGQRIASPPTLASPHSRHPLPTRKQTTLFLDGVEIKLRLPDAAGPHRGLSPTILTPPPPHPRAGNPLLPTSAARDPRPRAHRQRSRSASTGTATAPQPRAVLALKRRPAARRRRQPRRGASKSPSTPRSPSPAPTDPARRGGVDSPNRHASC